jgi:thioredoxin
VVRKFAPASESATWKKHAGAQSKRPGFMSPDQQECLLAEKAFFERLRNTPHPVVVDFWAPWCAPCRAIGTVVEKLGEEYAGRVDLWKVNADEQPDVLRALRIYGIPTLIAYHDGREVGRRTGATTAAALSALFESALTGEKPQRNGPALADRFLRLGVGLALVGLAIISGLSGMSLLLAGLGGVIMFTAIYDRCPIYRMMSARLKEIF